jgi:hypothetical protein
MEDTTMARPIRSTLLDLVTAVNSVARNEREVIATVTYLVNSGKVVLCGNFAGARIDVGSPIACAAA